MAFKFAWLCELLNQLDHNRLNWAASSSRAVNPDYRVIISWFNKYSHKIDRQGKGGHAFLSCLFPEHRADRVYNLQQSRLSGIFGRVLLLSVKRTARLNAWKAEGGTDFASCVEDVMRDAEFDVPSPRRIVTLEEVNEALDQLAANSLYSSSRLRGIANEKSPDDLLRPILRRLSSSEAKWFVRMLLKSFSPVQIPELFTMRQFHFLLPNLLAIQNTFETAIATLGGPVLSKIPPRIAKDRERASILSASKEVLPLLGVMVKRQPYDKARSIKHCCQIANRRTMSLETKYDGEYCQVHINMEDGKDPIQIFSKSGRDSTTDRIRLHGALRDALQISNQGCQIKQRCILEGELLVWSDSQQAIQPFHKLRRHVMHGGWFLGNEADSPAATNEHLMIMFYDLLLLDEVVYMQKSHRERRRRLEKLITVATGFAEIGHRETINFGSRKAPDQLRVAFAKCITQKWEGFVLKGSDDPYFSWSEGNRAIKLKKDYIAGLGDTADLAIVGGGHDPRVEQQLGLGRLSWTSFYLACLENKTEAQRHDAKPIYRILDVVSQFCVPKEIIALINRMGVFAKVDFSLSIAELDIRIDQSVSPLPRHLFRKPFVADVMGSGFEIPQRSTSYVLRFARVLKIHEDRSLKDVASFDELQELARTSMTVPEHVDSQEDRDWIARLMLADGKEAYIVNKSQSTTPGKSTTSGPTTSTSPNFGRKRKSPSFIRCDTSELSPGEKLFRQCEQTADSRKTPSRAPNVVQTRQTEFLPVEKSPRANSVSKHVKLTLLRTTVSRTSIGHGPEFSHKKNAPLPAKHCPRSVATSRSIKRLTRLNRTPPWCMGDSIHKSKATTTPFEPSAIFFDLGNEVSTRTPHNMPRVRERLASKSRVPLSKISNSFSSRSPPRLDAVKDLPIGRTTEKGSLQLGQAQALSNRLQEVPYSSVRARVAKETTNVLSTTPKSSTDRPDERHQRPSQILNKAMTVTGVDGASVLSRHATDRSIVHENRSVDSLVSYPMCSGLLIQAPLTTGKQSSFLEYDSPMLLGSSLSYLFRNETRPLDIVLPRLPVSFTFSTQYFLTRILSLGPSVELRLSIVIVDWTQHEAVAKEIRHLGLDLYRALTTAPGASPQSGCIIFQNWAFLHFLEYGDSGWERARRHFCGCLRWISRASDPAGQDTANVEVVWDWNNAIAI